jgi:hypothetical protein
MFFLTRKLHAWPYNSMIIAVPSDTARCAYPIALNPILATTFQDATISTLATDVAAKLQALRGLKGKLAEVQAYLAAVTAGKLPLNHDINAYLQVGVDGVRAC